MRTLGARIFSFLQMIVLLGLLGYAGHQSYYIFFEASYFKLAGVEVLNNVAVPEEEIIRRSGLTLGTPVFGIDRNAVAAKVCLHPRIERCFVSQKGPNNMVLRVVERQPLAKVLYNDDLYEVDDEGVLLGRASVGIKLPLVVGLEARTRGDGHPGLRDEDARLMARWLSLMADSMVGKPDEIDLSEQPKVRVRWRSLDLYVESVANFKRHVRYMEEILEDARLNDLRLTYLDFRFGDIVAKYENFPTRKAAATAWRGGGAR